MWNKENQTLKLISQDNICKEVNQPFLRGFAMSHLLPVTLGCRSSNQIQIKQWISLVSATLLIKTGSGDELRHRYSVISLTSCSLHDPLLAYAMSESPKLWGHCLGNSLPLPIGRRDKSHEESRDAEPVALRKVHRYFRYYYGIIVSLLPLFTWREILAICFSITKDGIMYCYFLVYTILSSGFFFPPYLIYFLSLKKALLSC